VKDREAWHVTVHGVAESDTTEQQHSDNIAGDYEGLNVRIKNVGYKKGALTWGIVENVLGAAVIPFYFMFGY